MKTNMETLHSGKSLFLQKQVDCFCVIHIQKRVDSRLEEGWIYE